MVTERIEQEVNVPESAGTRRIVRILGITGFVIFVLVSLANPPEKHQSPLPQGIYQVQYQIAINKIEQNHEGRHFRRKIVIFLRNAAGQEFVMEVQSPLPLGTTFVRPEMHEDGSFVLLPVKTVVSEKNEQNALQ